MSAEPPRTRPPAAVSHIHDDSVDATLDLQLRELLSACFTKPACSVFHERRYFNEPPQWRWIISDDQGVPVAHLAAHNKATLLPGQPRPVRIAGIAEVCVHPGHRGLGHVHMLLRQAHRWLADEGFVYAVLAGDPRIYASSGYRPVDNFFWDAVSVEGERVTRVRCLSAQVATLGVTPWPASSVYIPALPF